jgi:hypothetical protein
MFDDFLDGFYSKKEYILLLAYIKENQNEKDSYLNHIQMIQNQQNYDEKKQEFYKLYNLLINCGYLNQTNAQLYITEAGKTFLQDYSRFQTLNLTAKFTEIFKRHFTAIVTLASLFLSIASFIISLKK